MSLPRSATSTFQGATFYSTRSKPDPPFVVSYRTGIILHEECKWQKLTAEKGSGRHRPGVEGPVPSAKPARSNCSTSANWQMKPPQKSVKDAASKRCPDQLRKSPDGVTVSRACHSRHQTTATRISIFPRGNLIRVKVTCGRRPMIAADLMWISMLKTEPLSWQICSSSDR